MLLILLKEHVPVALYGTKDAFAATDPYVQWEPFLLVTSNEFWEIGDDVRSWLCKQIRNYNGCPL